MQYFNSSSLLKAEMAQQQVKTIEKAQSKNNHLNIQHIFSNSRKQQIYPTPSLVLLTDQDRPVPFVGLTKAAASKFCINLLVKAQIQTLFLDICAVCIQAHCKTKTSSNPQWPIRTANMRTYLYSAQNLFWGRSALKSTKSLLYKM